MSLPPSFRLGTASLCGRGNVSLGGCSLRGGEGTVIGMLLGTAVLPLLRNLINFSAIPDDLTFTVIGVALLLGTIADELLKRRATAMKN